MDLIPQPGQVVTAAGNVTRSVMRGGLADLRPMPRTLIEEGELREVYHYEPAGEVPEAGNPVLLVPPLAAPALCFDLRRGCSLVEHFVGLGVPTYLVEYGEVAFHDRSLDMTQWIDEVLPKAIKAVSQHAGGRPVHLIGWSLGGIFALLTAADQPSLPIASLTIAGTPVDLQAVPLVAPARPLFDLTQGTGIATRAFRALGATPQLLVDWALTTPPIQKLVTKPLTVLAHLDDAEFLAQIEAVEEFTARTSAYPGRTFGQLYHRMLASNALVGGTMDVGNRTIALSSITAPVLVFGGASDAIAPIGAVRPVVDLLTGAEEVRFEIVPGGHLGLLTGRAAKDSTWTVMAEWIQQWPSPTPRRTTKKAVAKKSAPKKKTAKKAAVKKASPEAIGSNPERRYGSPQSRSLRG